MRESKTVSENIEMNKSEYLEREIEDYKTKLEKAKKDGDTEAAAFYSDKINDFKNELSNSSSENGEKGDSKKTNDAKGAKEFFEEIGEIISDKVEELRAEHKEKKEIQEAKEKEMYEKLLRDNMQRSIAANRKGMDTDFYLDNVKEYSKKTGYDIYGDDEFWEEFYAAGRESVEDHKKKMDQWLANHHTPTYGMPTTEAGWNHLASQEFAKNGESPYYHSLRQYAAECHVKEESK